MKTFKEVILAFKWGYLNLCQLKNMAFHVKKIVGVKRPILEVPQIKKPKLG